LRLLDLFCGAGGCSYGYARAGFDVVGVDINPQPNYPYTFIKADVLTLDPDFLKDFEAIHASPPCQAHSTLKYVQSRTYVDLIGETRELLRATELPYVIENVPNAPLIDPIELCGSSFKLRVRRHRKFESNIELISLPCDHEWQDASPMYKIRMSKSRGLYRMSGIIPAHGGLQLMPEHFYGMTELDLVGDAMGIHWMTKKEINQAIPPMYTKYIGRQLADFIELRGRPSQ
jgi:DNA (cytosine-5)-methyltransferase 1